MNISKVIEREPTTKEKELIGKLRRLLSGEVVIVVEATEPVNAKVYHAQSIEGAIPGHAFTEKEKRLLTITRITEFGEVRIKINLGEWDGEIQPESYIRWKF